MKINLLATQIELLAIKNQRVRQGMNQVAALQNSLEETVKTVMRELEIPENEMNEWELAADMSHFKQIKGKKNEKK